MKLKQDKTIGEVRSDVALDIEMAKEKGTKVVGCLCSYFPQEMVRAAGAISVGLCGTTEEKIELAEEIIPADQCPMVKATYGRAISGNCLLFPLTDCIVGETTCDGRKKMYELMSREKPMHVMELPQMPDEKEALVHWIAEVRKLKNFIEYYVGEEITDKGLRNTIKQMNEERKLLKEIHRCRRHNPVPIMGLDLVGLSTMFSYSIDRKIYKEKLTMLLEELKQRINREEFACSPKRPRILWTGLGNSLGCDKVLRLVEECGGVVVCQEGCGGITRIEDMVDEEKDPIEAIAERYLRVTCSCMTPNTRRFEDIDRLISEYTIQGVIDLTWQSCHTFNIESYRVGELVKGKHSLPFLHIVTDFSQSDVGQLRVRIEGFLEQITLGSKDATYRCA
ncbi:MAG: double-cubane-cluster-containing anaerobic reductase [Thermodesulfobacteriota bacterium]|nr:double-cubane-cluster-containing anaerobic reductase [Thermodesulfobacteriota bacterium]